MPSAHASSPPYNEMVPGYLEDIMEEPSAGTNSSASDKKPEPNGSSGTPGHPSHAQSAENPSEPDPAASPAQSSSASSTDGSTQETSSSQHGQQDSSEAEGAEAPPTDPQKAEPDPEPEPIPVAAQKAAGVPADETVTVKEQKQGAEAPIVAEDLMQAARSAFEGHNYDEAVELLNQAKAADPTLAPDVARALSAVATARAS